MLRARAMFATMAYTAENNRELKPAARTAFDRELARAFDKAQAEKVAELLSTGQHIFRYDTFGSEDFWGGRLRLHDSIEGVSPKLALELGLKVDMDAIPQRLIAEIKRGMFDLNDPAGTL